MAFRYTSDPPYTPFPESVTPPDTDPDTAPTVSVCFSQDWMPYVLTCLKALSMEATWKGDDANAIALACKRGDTLLGSFVLSDDPCGLLLPTRLCLSGSFKDDKYGFEVTPGAQCNAIWTPGVGWQECCTSAPQAFLQIERNFGVSTVINGFALTINLTSPYLINYDITLYQNGTFTSIASATSVTGPTININVTGLNIPADSIQIHIQESIGGCASDVILTDWKLCYTGAFPLSQAPGFTHVFDFTASDGGWHVRDTGEGTYVSGTGWRKGSGTIARCVIRKSVPLGTIIRSVVLEYDWTFGSGDISVAGRHISYLNSGNTSAIATILDQGTNRSAILSAVGSPDTLQLNIWTCTQAGCSNGSVTMRRCIVSGDGPDPF